MEEKALTELREDPPTRLDGTPIPLRWPRGWMHLSALTAKLICTAYGDAKHNWWDHYLAALQLSTFCTVPSTIPSQMELVDHVTGALSSHFRIDSIRTGFGRVGGGSTLEPMPVEWWALENERLRFKSWSIDPLDPFSEAINLPCWIYVREDDANMYLDKLWRKRWQIGKEVWTFDFLRLPVALDLLMGRGLSGNEAWHAIIAAGTHGAVDAMAHDMTRAFDGEWVQAEKGVKITPEMWQGVDPTDLRFDDEKGLFYSQVGRSEYLFNATMVSKKDVLALRDKIGPPAEEEATEHLPELPPNAKPSDHKHAVYAHRAAKIVREEQIRPGTAFKRVAPEEPMRNPESICRAIRAAYDLLYTADGHPHPD